MKSGNKLTRAVNRWRFSLRRRLGRTVSVDDGDYQLKFHCENAIELARALTLRVKEAGTVQWIRDHVSEGDVFYDVGANIGIYTLMAAQRVGAAGRVYSFEPHLASAHNLMRNVRLNGLQDRVRVLSCALHNEEGFFDFNYQSDRPGSGMSQCNDTRDDLGRSFDPIMVELKTAITADHLIDCDAIRPATLVKLDVDGNEQLILEGMKGLLSGPHCPRQVQVELSPRNRDQVYQFMESVGLHRTSRHETLNGKNKIASGVDPEDISHNVIFSSEQRAQAAA